MPGPASQIDSYRSQKTNALRLVVIASALLATFLILRLVPALDDALSGKPQYMRWVSDKVAKSIAARYGNEAAVILLSDEKTHCRQISAVNVPNPDDFYYVLRYSETRHSVCFITSANLPDGWDQTNSLLLYPNIGQNYGQNINRPVRVVAVSQLQMVYPMAYLSLLHWRTKIDSSSFKRAANAKFERWFNSTAEPSDSLDVEIDFPSLRADVGRNHWMVNRALAAAISVAAALVFFGAYKTWSSYTAFRGFLSRYRRHVGFGTYLRQDLTVISGHARQAFQEEQRRALEETRAAILLNRSREAIRARLESLLSATSDERQKHNVQECLNRGELEEMKALTQQLQGQTGQKTSEEKLTTLLDTLKQYCNGEEFDRLCADAFQVLATTGFREARSFVVDAHDQLRARSKELEEQATVGTE